MNPTITAALIFVALLLLSLPILRLFIQRLIVQKAENTQIVERDPLLVDLQPGKPAVIYFTSPDCGPCKTTQQPILRQLQADYGDKVQLLTINVMEKTDHALRWGVMKVPRTFILDHNLRTHITNMGIAYLDVLKQQIEDAERSADLPPQPIKIVQ